MGWTGRRVQQNLRMPESATMHHQTVELKDGGFSHSRQQLNTHSTAAAGSIYASCFLSVDVLQVFDVSERRLFNRLCSAGMESYVLL